MIKLSIGDTACSVRNEKASHRSHRRTAGQEIDANGKMMPDSGSGARMRFNNSIPDRRLRFEPEELRLREYPRSFFRGDTVRIARSLIGAWFARNYRGEWYGARIVETEAYLGAQDPAAHSYRGRRTPRVEPMYEDGGHLYVFFVYGMHHCANIVTRPQGTAHAVLLRAAEGPSGTPPELLSGPARLCAALGITRASSGLDLLAGNDLRLLFPSGPKPRIGTSRRIGIDYAEEARDWPLRFFDEDSPAVSGPARLRTSQTSGLLRKT